MSAVEQRPGTLTMAKVMYEEEDPQIHAWLIADFWDGRGPVECPLTVYSANWHTVDNHRELRWYMETWVPLTDCIVHHLKVFFPSCDDFSVVRLDRYVPACHGLEVSTTQSRTIAQWE